MRDLQAAGEGFMKRRPIDQTKLKETKEREMTRKALVRHFEILRQQERDAIIEARLHALEARKNPLEGWEERKAG